MIKPGEIDKIAIAQGVRAKQIEKDYVISWILWGISRNEFISKHLVFKGGTCLKKMYYSDYRYSEDMDFTLRNDDISDEEILRNFQIIFAKIHEASRLTIEITEDSIDYHETSGSLTFKLSYSATHGKDQIKVDITRKESIEFETEYLPVLQQYTDLTEEEETGIHCYSLKEVFIEKMTALMGRTISRDLYDFYFLIEEALPDPRDVAAEFMRKASQKGHDPKELLHVFMQKAKTFERDWQISLGKQMKQSELPDFNNVWRKSIQYLKHFVKLL
jgi:uncharacterized protein